MKNGYGFLEHTADIGIEAEGASLEELFANAANGLRDLIFGALPAQSELVDVEVFLEGIDEEELLVSWLNEILFLFETRRFVPMFFQVLQVGREGISAKISGIYFSDQIGIQREVKAVTYHRLKLEKTRGGWRARLFVDL